MPRIKWGANGRDGRWVPDDVIEDKKTLRVPMILFDSNRTALRDTFQLDGADLDQFRPGFRMISDAQRAAVSNARAEMIDRATNAWRMDARKRKPEPDEDDDEDDQDESDARAKDARGFARRSQEGSHAGRHQAAHTDARLDGQRFRLDDLRKPSILAREEMIRKLQDAWKS
jgi:hypothetical protein